MEVTDDFMDPYWDAARRHVRWVIVENAGAQATFCKCKTEVVSIPKDKGSRNYLCVLYAQMHNPEAERSIREYGPDRTDKYIASLGGTSC